MPNDFHRLQVIVAATTLLVALLLHTFGPIDRTLLLHDIALACMAFLFGKFTNGVSRGKPTDRKTPTPEE